MLLLGVIVYNGLPQEELQPPMGSVGQTQGYSYTLFSGSALATTTLIQAGTTMLGSAIITEDAASTVFFYDATSTEAVTDGPATLYDAMAVLESAQAEGVYTFDAYATRGLVVVLTDGFTFAGNMTVTWRQGW